MFRNLDITFHKIDEVMEMIIRIKNFTILLRGTTGKVRMVAGDMAAVTHEQA